MEYNLPTLTDQPLTLPDGTELTAQQHNAVTLKATTSMTFELIAQHAGYSSKGSVAKFLASDKGKRGLENAVRTHLLDGATVALQTMIALAKGAKSENVRQMAAADLMDRAGLRLEAKQDTGTGNREVNISINLTTGDEPAQVIQHDKAFPAENTQSMTADGGAGEKREGMARATRPTRTKPKPYRSVLLMPNEHRCFEPGCVEGAPYGFRFPGRRGDVPSANRGYLWACAAHRVAGEARRDAGYSKAMGVGAIALHQTDLFMDDVQVMAADAAGRRARA